MRDVEGASFPSTPRSATARAVAACAGIERQCAEGAADCKECLEEIEATSYVAVGRKYGVSDNAVRKWVRFYERQIEREEAEGAAASKPG